MLASRDQENLLHSHQTAAAAKPLNQGARVGFAPKTPGPNAPKTPFKVPLNDENGGLRAGKTILQAKGKDAENVLAFGRKDGGLDKHAFITPVAPRNRAPLGIKPTNAKARPFQTPAVAGNDDPLQKTQKPSGSVRRQKPKILQAAPIISETQAEGNDLEEREIEYMPPRSIDLPDDPDDIYPPNQTYPMLEDENRTRGWWQTSAYLVEDEEAREKREAEENARFEKMLDDMVDKSIERERYIEWDIPEHPGAETVRGLPKAQEEKAKQSSAETAKKPLTSKGPSTINARSAARALSQSSKPSIQPHFAAPTIVAKAKAPSSIVSSKKAIGQPVKEDPSSVRHASATAASRTTLGFAKGRAASSSLRSVSSTSRSLSQTNNHLMSINPEYNRKPSGSTQLDDTLPFLNNKRDPASASVDEELLLRSTGLDISSRLDEESAKDEEESLPAWMKAPSAGLDEEDEYADFQLVVPDF